MITILIFAIAAIVTLYGLYVIIVGKCKVMNENILAGLSARLIGFIYFLSFPFVVFVVILLQLFLLSQGYSIEETETKKFTLLFWVFMALAQVLILFCGLKLSNHLYRKSNR